MQKACSLERKKRLRGQLSKKMINKRVNMAAKKASDCGSVGRAIASFTSGLRFESSYWQNMCKEHLFAVNLLY